MRAWTIWSRRREFWDRIPTVSYVTFLAGIFLMFMSGGLLDDLSNLGSNPPSRLVAGMMLSGGLTVAYVLAFRWPRWLVGVIAIHALVVTRPEYFLPARTPPLVGGALYRRMQTDANLILGLLTASFIVLSHFARREGTRYVRAHTEIALARDIHRLLVPPIGRRVGRFEFRGVSIPSGDVGGDLIDLVESDGHWIGYVADVSGHGVGAGLLMGMVKSAARTQLRATQLLDQLVTTLNVVLLDLKKPEMFVTFAGVQFDGAPELQFIVAGHLPILHYRSETCVVEELSTPQVPLAIVGDRVFVAARTACGVGDLFVILTDGLTEVFDGQDREFGLNGVKALVQAHAGSPLDSLEHALLAAVRAHGSQLDDQTLLLIRMVA
jgi:hypothetical protein